MNNKTRLTSIFTLLIAATVSACGGGGGGSAPPASNPTPVPTTTAVGVTDDDLVGSSATITAAGGSISTGDNKITLTVPAGALASDTLIQINRITNTAHGGIGGGFRLLPDGQTFSQPVTLTFTYTDDELAGSDPEVLGAAFQTAEGHWQWVGTPVIDTTNHTVSISSTHFTDFSMVKGFQIQPDSETVLINSTKALRVVYCYAPSVGDDELQPLGYDCDSSDDDLAPLLPIPDVSNWSVNGVAGGNNTVGTVSGSSTTATYQAPDTVPRSNPVAVSAQVAMGSGTATVVANITVTSNESYSGDILFSVQQGSLSVTNGTANITWTLIETIGEGKFYQPSGTVEATFTPKGCVPVTSSVPINVLHALAYSLKVYGAATPIFGSTHDFSLVAGFDSTLDFNCNTDPDLESTFSVAVAFSTHACNESSTSTPYDDVTHLHGTYHCVHDKNVTDVLWDFTQD